MVRKTRVSTVHNARGGQGSLESYNILNEEELRGHGTQYSLTVLHPHSSIGWHIHETNTEPYFILKGHGIFIDNEGKTEVGPGDVCVINVGEGHSLENPTDEDLIFMALIYNA